MGAHFAGGEVLTATAHHGAAFARRLELAIGVRAKLAGLRLAARRSFAWRATAGSCGANAPETAARRRARRPAGFRRGGAAGVHRQPAVRQIQPGAHMQIAGKRARQQFISHLLAQLLFFLPTRRTSRASISCTRSSVRVANHTGGQDFLLAAQGHQRHFALAEQHQGQADGAQPAQNPGTSSARRRRKRALLQRGLQRVQRTAGPGIKAIQVSCLNHIRGVHAKRLGQRIVAELRHPQEINRQSRCLAGG